MTASYASKTGGREKEKGVSGKKSLIEKNAARRVRKEVEKSE